MKEKNKGGAKRGGDKRGGGKKGGGKRGGGKRGGGKRGGGKRGGGKRGGYKRGGKIIGLPCSICCTDFDESQHLPKVLIPCGHTICESCLNSILKQIVNDLKVKVRTLDFRHFAADIQPFLDRPLTGNDYQALMNLYDKDIGLAMPCPVCKKPIRNTATNYIFISSNGTFIDAETSPEAAKEAAEKVAAAEAISDRFLAAAARPRPPRAESPSEEAQLAQALADSLAEAADQNIEPARQRSPTNNSARPMSSRSAAAENTPRTSRSPPLFPAAENTPRTSRSPPLLSGS